MTVLYVREQGATVACRGGRILVHKEGKTIQQLPSDHVSRVMLFGNVSLTTPAATYFLRQGVDTVLLTQSGRYRGRLQGPIAKDADLRRRQYRRWENRRHRLALAQLVVSGKINNMAALCRRQRGEVMGGQTAKRLTQFAQRAMKAETAEILRGHEGAASAAYFRALRAFLRPELGFRGRNQRPPKDPANALLSFGYTLLHNELVAQIESAGLDPYLGFFHETKPGHAALASDLMEEWRPVIVDSLVLFLTGRREITREDFAPHSAGIWLKPEGKARFLSRYEDRLARRIYHEERQQRLTYRQCIEEQVRQIAEYARGRRDSYTPFRAR